MPVTPLKDRAAIVGIGQTGFGRGLEDSELSLACQAISAALDDCGLSASQVDGLVSYTLEPGREVEVARSVGLGSITASHRSATAGEQGQAWSPTRLWPWPRARRRWLWRGGRERSAKSAAPGSPLRRPRLNATTPSYDPVWPSAPRRTDCHDDATLHARVRGDRDRLANVALAFRKHANRNPRAIMYDRPLTRGEYMTPR